MTNEKNSRLLATIDPAIADAGTMTYGKWQVTDTVCSTRKNLFCIDPNSGYHVGTIVSGSRSRLDRFEHSLSLIRAAPEMLYVLEAVAASLRAGDGFDRSALLSEIESVLDGVAPTPGEE